jgi:lysophospholipase L1-like esterase
MPRAHAGFSFEKLWQVQTVLRMNRKRFLLAVSILSLMIGTELALRISMPELGADQLRKPEPHEKPPIQLNDQIGYEPTPSALHVFRTSDGVTIAERYNKEGFRGPDSKLPKPKGTFRILAIGDSVVEGILVTYGETWEKVLEDMLDSSAAEPRSNLDCEVINAGVGGYVSWQALSRLKERGLKYEPDIVMVLVGWNDMLYSSLPMWRPYTDAAKIEKARNEGYHEGWRERLRARIRGPMYRACFIARLLSKGVNTIRDARLRKTVIEKHKVDSGLKFNEDALTLYVENLEEIYRAVSQAGARMALITWPTIIGPGFLEDMDIDCRLTPIQRSCPLSARELWSWYARYEDAQRGFKSAHPDIIFVDAASTFLERDKGERLSLFLDLAHLTPRGNRELAEMVMQELRKERAIPESPRCVVLGG